MAKNIIFYGPPGTGKTFLIQKMWSDYIDYTILDSEIRNISTQNPQSWVLLALILLQNNNAPMTSGEIAQKCQQLNIVQGMTLSNVLDKHSVDLPAHYTPQTPQIFKQDNNKYYLLVSKLLEHDHNFFTRLGLNQSINKRYEFVTFHQSFSYEDFVEGIRPIVNQTNATGQPAAIGYSIQPGVFKRICDEASQNPHKEYAIFIDEINRGNISEIFGELITLIEPDKRVGMPNGLLVTLPYSKTSFGVPSNLNIFGTMNSADRSISLIDFALRRRFEFVKITYDSNALGESLRLKGLNPTQVDGINVIALLDVINIRIQLFLDANFVIGHAYFTNVRNFADIKEAIVNKVIPLLEEYFYDDQQKIQIVLADLDDDGELKPNAIYKHELLEVDNWLEFSGEYGIEDKKNYYIHINFGRDAVQKIYLAPTSAAAVAGQPDDRVGGESNEDNGR